ncbi:hypothetical protein AB0M32_38950 [Streptomyces sp. NPDC051985]|uniref:hypothetical protein n=1 Tax=Streptomyces sp. NPDC051985 TaxID=3155807 RepID=UPI0034237A78
MTAGFITATRTFYDAIADEDAGHFRAELVNRPLERPLLAAYVELVGTGGEVADLSCGGGRSGWRTC